MFNFRFWKTEVKADDVSVKTFTTAPRRLVSGAESVSTGAYSRVYDSVIPNTVVKRGSDFTDGYILFLACVFDLGPQPIFPRIHMVHVDKRLGEFWVLMEKLTPQLDYKGDWWNDPRLYGDRAEDYAGKLKPYDVSCLSSMYHWLKNSGLEFTRDLHHGNWMMRGQQPVVTDPICGGYDKQEYLVKLEEVVARKGLNIISYGD